MSANPFISIWFHPVETLKDFIQFRSTSHSIFFSMLAGISSFIFALHQSGWQEGVSNVLFAVAILLFGSIWGIVVWAFSAYTCTWIGRFYGGTGSLRQMGLAIGPMVLPQVFLLPVYLLYIASFGQRFFAAPDPYSLSSLPVGPYVVLIVLLLCSMLWMLVISSKGIGVVHNFSAWLGLAVIITIAGFTMLFGGLLFFTILFVFF